MEEKKTGRPTDFSEKIVDQICERISEGESLRTICADDNMPTKTTVFRWLAKEENKEFRDQYARAREIQAENLAEEMFEIADDGTNDWMTIGRGDNKYEIENKEVTNRSKLRVETRKWYLSKILPKKYGDKLDVAHSGHVKTTRIIRDDIPRDDSRDQPQ